MILSNPPYKSYNAFITIILACLLAFAFAAPTATQALVSRPFHPTTATKGTRLGNCDAHRHFLDAAFQEAVDMAKLAVKAIDQVKFGRDNWIAFSNEARISASLQAMFGVKTGASPEPMTETNDRMLEYVQGERSLSLMLGQ